jgi:hypothetical protein
MGAMGNLCFILKCVLQKSCYNHNCNMTLFAIAFIYSYIQLHVPLFIYSYIQLHVPLFTQFKSQGQIGSSWAQ